MKRYAAKQTVSKPSTSCKPQQKKTNATNTHTGRPSEKGDAVATVHKTRTPLPGGWKQMKSGIRMPRRDNPPHLSDCTTDETDSDWTICSTASDSDETTESTDVVEANLPVRNQRHETIVLLDIKDVPLTTEDEALPLCSNENSEDFSAEHNGQIIKVRDATRAPEWTRKGRQGKVTYAISAKHFLHPTCGIRNAFNSNVNVSAIQVRTPESAQCGGVTISPGMLARIETSHRWLLIQAIAARPSGDARYFHYDLIT